MLIKMSIPHIVRYVRDKQNKKPFAKLRVLNFSTSPAMAGSGEIRKKEPNEGLQIWIEASIMPASM
jgi:hypothetical protein